jgi:maltose alpha-D-glucosyltransferase / alpha-amylase
MPAPRTVPSAFDSDPLWYKKAVIYQLHVRSFCDGDGNGIGDFRGLTSKLDYLSELGVSALWLMPFYPSPLRDDGYDIANYFDINPIYGTLADFKTFLRAAHDRGMRVITEVVINHTSDQHEWFQKSRRAAPGSKWRDFYVWSDTMKKYESARIIFRDFEPSNWTWDPVAKGFFWHRFYSHQPDLNFDNPAVHREILRIVDFWLDMGVDGLRLDAIPYLYEREGTSCENLPETHAYLKSLRAHVDAKYKDRMLLAEANQWPEDSAAYFGDGNECHMAFHFPIMPRLFMSVRMEDRLPITDILDQTPTIPANSQWAVFLRNHDELTLEMVTDEERDYMYRVYASDPKARINLGIRRRLAPLLGNDRRRIELLNGLLLSLPGTPIIYYGDEIGMGDNVFLPDRNGVRTPMQWSSDRNAGFSRANPQGIFLPIIITPEYHYETINVEAQDLNPSSLLWWMRRLIALREKYPVFGEGTMEMLHPENRKVLAYLRRLDDQVILVVANLSRFAQPVYLDLSAFKGRKPVELFGSTPFPPITDAPYLLTMGPHSFHWFSLSPSVHQVGITCASVPGSTPALQLKDDWESIFDERHRSKIEALLPTFLCARRWFGGKARTQRSVAIADAVPVRTAGRSAVILLIHIEYLDADAETYALPVAFATGAEAARIEAESPALILAPTAGASEEMRGVLYDATGSIEFAKALLEAILRRRSFEGAESRIECSATSALKQLGIQADISLAPKLSAAEQSNTAIRFGDRLLLKLFRRPESGINPELEIGRALTASRFKNSPPLAGAIKYVASNGEQTTLGVLHGFVAGAIDGWEYTIEALGRYYDRVRSFGDLNPFGDPPAPRLDGTIQTLDGEVGALLGAYVESARLLGQRTAELHIALAEDRKDPAFTPEAFTPHYQRGLYQSFRNLARQNLLLLERKLGTLDVEQRELAAAVIAAEDRILAVFHRLSEAPLTGLRIRVHGDYHLGQTLYTGRDFFIVDFEGEPAVALSERRMKRTPFRDVAGLLRSFDYAANAALRREIEQGAISPASLPRFAAWASRWTRWISTACIESYLSRIGISDILPKSVAERSLLLQTHLLRKAVYEIGYEVNNRPGWLSIPCRGILALLAESDGGG